MNTREKKEMALEFIQEKFPNRELNVDVDGDTVCILYENLEDTFGLRFFAEANGIEFAAI